MAQGQGAAFVEQSLAVERGDDRRTQFPGECLDLGGRSPHKAPPPAKMIGRVARARISAARAIASAGTAGWGRSANAGDSIAPAQVPRIRSWGRKSAAGRGRPQVIA